MASGGARLGSAGASPPPLPALSLYPICRRSSSRKSEFVGQPEQLRDQVRRRPGRAADQLHDRFAAETLKVHRLDRMLAAAVQQQGALAVFRRHLGVDVDPDHPQLRRVDVAQHVTEKEEGRLVGPVQLVDDEEDGPARRHLVQRRRHRLEEAEAFALGVSRFLLEWRRVFPQAQHEPRQLGQLPVGHVADAVGRERLEVTAECLGEGLERGHRVLVAAPPQDQRAVALGGGANSATSRVFPMPASPSTSKNRPLTAPHCGPPVLELRPSRSRPISGPSFGEVGTRTRYWERAPAPVRPRPAQPGQPRAGRGSRGRGRG